MNKQISSGAGIAMVAVVAIAAGIIMWLVMATKKVTPAQLNPVPAVKTNSMQGQIQNQIAPQSPISNQSAIQNPAVSANIQFDSCGKKEKYSRMSW